jgi:predicted deacylase
MDETIRRGLVVVAVFFLAGCEGSTPPPAEPTPTAARAPLAAPRALVESARAIGRSVEGRPIDMFIVGTPAANPVLILAGIHGNERNSSACAQLLLEHLRAHRADLAGVPLALIPAANPDGLAKNLRFNAHRVDLNRNFPASNWSRTYAGGPAPASEPETQALIALLSELKPRRILSIHSHTTDPCNNFDGPASKLALAMTSHNGYPTMASIGYPTPGSLGSWAGIDRGIPIITLELPAKESGPAAWEHNRDAILGFMRGEE